MKLKSIILSLLLSISFSLSAETCRKPGQESKLIRAVSENLAEKVLKELKRGISPDTRSCAGYPALHVAISRKNLAIMNLLVQYKANINLKDPKDDTPLHRAVSKVWIEGTKFLLENKANPNLLNSYATPLMLATTETFAEGFQLMKLLLKYEANPNFKTPFLEQPTALSLLLRDYGRIPDASARAQLLLENGANANSAYQEDSILTLMHYAVFSNNIEFLKLLIKYSGDPNFALNGMPSLCSIARINNSDSLEHLKEMLKLPVVNVDCHCSNEPFLFRLLGDPVKTKLVLDYGANPLIKNIFGETALMELAYHPMQAWKSSAPLFIAAGVDINAGDSSGGTALHKAVLRDNISVTEAIIEAGAHINQLDKYGNAPINYASTLSTMKILVAHGADLNIDNSFPIIFQVIAYNPDPTILKWLHQNGADFKRRWSIGLTALEYAEMIDSSPEIIALIKEFTESK